jgi:hypothetical protein
MGHTPFAIESTRGDRTVGVLFLAHVRSLLFGRFLVSLPYLNSGGVCADDGIAASALAERAVSLADNWVFVTNHMMYDNPSSAGTDKVHISGAADGGSCWGK